MLQRVLDGVGSNLKTVIFFVQHSGCCMILYSVGHVHATLLHKGMSASSTGCAPGAWDTLTSTCSVENVENVCVWPAHSAHVATSCNHVAECCIEMLQAFGQAVTL